MNMDFTYWYLFPMGIIIATLAMSAGISGANFWIPVYLVFIKLDPLICFWLALLTMVFGFGSGVIRNIYEGTVNWHIVRLYLIPTVPAAVLGSLLTSFINGNFLVLIFGTFVFVYGTYMFISSIASKKSHPKHRKVFWVLGLIAGFLKGLIATGLGKLIVPAMWNHERIRHPSEVIGSAIIIIFIVDIVAALTRMNHGFVSGLLENRTILFNVLIFVIPSVIIGRQIGPRTIKNANIDRMNIYISLMLIAVSMLILSRLWI